MEQRIENSNIALPLVVLLAACAALYWYPSLSVDLQAIFVWLPYALGAVALSLSWMFNRRQLVVVVLVCCFSYWLIHRFLQQPLSQPDALLCFTLVSLLVPFNLLLNQAISENGVKTLRAKVMYGVVALQGLALYLIVMTHPQALLELAQSAFAPRPIEGLIISLYALAAAGLWMAISFVLFLLKPNSMSMGLFFSLLAAIAPLAFLDREAISSVFFSASMLLVLISGMRTSHELAYRDELTGLLGRRMLFEKLSGIGRQYTVAMVDIDHFKSFNDTYGHDVGDDVLAMVASRLATVGGGGQVFRYGGEEFTALFKTDDIEHAREHLDAIRQEISDTPFAIRDKKKRDKQSAKDRQDSNKPKKTVQITVSIGVATKTAKHDDPEEVIKDADKALYKAKEGGRNQVVAARK